MGRGRGSLAAGMLRLIPRVFNRIRYDPCRQQRGRTHRHDGLPRRLELTSDFDGEQRGRLRARGNHYRRC